MIIMNDDSISRQSAIDALAKFVPYAICDESTESYTNGLTDAYNLILQLPSAQPEQRWVPCSEGLPDEHDVVNVTTIYGDVMSGFLSGVWWYLYYSNGEDGEDMVYQKREVIAWQPLPEPYKGEHHE